MSFFDDSLAFRVRHLYGAAPMRPPLVLIANVGAGPTAKERHAAKAYRAALNVKAAAYLNRRGSARYWTRRMERHARAAFGRKWRQA